MEGLRDTDAIKGRRQAEQDFARWWSAHPALAGLRPRLAALDHCDAPALIQAAAPLIDDLGWIADALRTAVRAAGADPWFEPPLRPLDHARQLGLTFYDDRRLRVSALTVPLERIAAYKAAPLGGRSVGFTGALTRYRVIRAADTRLDLWETDAAEPGFAAASAGRCRPAGCLSLADGMTFTIDGRTQAWTIAHQAGDLVLLQATAGWRDALLATEYDAATGAFVSASATDGAAARMQLMASLLRRLKRRDAAPVLAELAEEGPFYLRWHLARELVALDRAAAAPLLARFAASDAHEEVRAAARRTLELLAA